MIIEQLKQNSKDFNNYILSKRIYTSKGVSIEEWIENFQLNDSFNDVMFIYYHDISYIYETKGYTSLDQLKDEIVYFYSTKKRYTSKEYNLIKDKFQVVFDSTIRDNFEGKSFKVVMIAASVKELYNSLKSGFESESVSGVDFTPSNGPENNSNTSSFVGQSVESFTFEATSGSIKSDYPDRIKPIKINEKLIEPNSNKGPYKTPVNQVDESKIILSEINKKRIIDAFDSRLEYEKNDCFETAYKLANNYKDIYSNIVSKLDFNLLGSLVLSQVNSFIEGNEEDIICTSKDIKNLLLCPVIIDPFNLPDLNKIGSLSVPNLNFPTFDLNYDWFAFIRKLIEDTVVSFILRLLNEILNYIFDILDCDDINKFLIKCKSTTDLRSTSFLQNVNIENYFNNSIQQTYIDIQNGIDKFDLNIDLQEYLNITKQIFSSFNVSQLQSLSNGVFSGQFFRLIKNLIQSIVGDRVSEDKYVSIINIINDTVDSSLLTENDNIVHDECIHFMPLVLLLNNLTNQGHSQEEAQKKVDEEKQKKIEAAKSICKLIRSDIDDFKSDRFLTFNAEITKYTLEKTIDNIFNSLGKDNNRLIESNLKNLLLNTFGDINIAAYYLFENSNFNEKIINKVGVENKFKQELFGGGSDLEYYSNFSLPKFNEKYNLIKESQELELKLKENSLVFGENTFSQFFYKTYRSVSTIKDFNKDEYQTYNLNSDEINLDNDNINSLSSYFVNYLSKYDESIELKNTIRSINQTNYELFNIVYKNNKRKYDDLLSSYFLSELSEEKSLTQTDKYKFSKLDFLQLESARKEIKDALLNG